MFPEKYELKIEEYPENEEYKMGGPSWIVKYSNFIVRPEPLSLKEILNLDYLD